MYSEYDGKDLMVGNPNHTKTQYNSILALKNQKKLKYLDQN